MCSLKCMMLLRWCDCLRNMNPSMVVAEITCSSFVTSALHRQSGGWSRDVGDRSHGKLAYIFDLRRRKEERGGILFNTWEKQSPLLLCGPFLPAISSAPVGNATLTWATTAML